jgi:hypothetical protein
MLVAGVGIGIAHRIARHTTSLRRADKIFGNGDENAMVAAVAG